MSKGAFIGVVVVLLVVVGAVVAYFMMGDETDKNLGPGGPSGPSGPSGKFDSQCTDNACPNHPLNGLNFIRLEGKFDGESNYPYIYPDPNDENLVKIHQTGEKTEDILVDFQPVLDKRDTYKLFFVKSGKYLTYWNDGFVKTTTSNPGSEYDIRVDGGRGNVIFSKYDGNNTIYFGYQYDGKMLASFSRSDMSAWHNRFTIESYSQ